MTDKVETKKPGIRLSPTLISMIVGLLLIGARFWAVASTATETRMRITQLEKEVIELKTSHTTFKEINDKLGEINVRIGKIETRLDIEKEE